MTDLTRRNVLAAGAPERCRGDPGRLFVGRRQHDHTHRRVGRHLAGFTRGVR